MNFTKVLKYSTTSLFGSPYLHGKVFLSVTPAKSSLQSHSIPRTKDKSQDHAVWSSATESALINILLQAVQDGCKSDYNFKKSVYTFVATQLASLRFSFTSDQVKSCWSRVSYISAI